MCWVRDVLGESILVRDIPGLVCTVELSPQKLLPRSTICLFCTATIEGAVTLNTQLMEIILGGT